MNNSASTRSSTPPCAPRSVPESLTPASLLMRGLEQVSADRRDGDGQARTAPPPTARTTARRRSRKQTTAAVPPTMPATSPSTLLFGETDGASGVFPNSEPKRCARTCRPGTCRRARRGPDAPPWSSSRRSTPCASAAADPDRLPSSPPRTGASARLRGPSEIAPSAKHAEGTAISAGASASRSHRATATDDAGRSARPSPARRTSNRARAARPPKPRTRRRPRPATRHAASPTITAAHARPPRRGAHREPRGQVAQPVLASCGRWRLGFGGCHLRTLADG